MEKQTKKAMYYDGQFEGPCPDRDPDFVWAPDSTVETRFWFEEMLCCNSGREQPPKMRRVKIGDSTNEWTELRDEIWRAYTDWQVEQTLLG